MVIDPLIATNIVGQLGPLVAVNKWRLDRRPANLMRGVDFYNATDFVSALVLTAHLFKNTHGYLPQMASPVSFNEHIFTRKFFAPLPLPSLADKLGVRDYVRARLGESVLSSIVWIGDNINELFAATLPAGRFVLKANHGSEMNLYLNLPEDLVARRSEIEEKARKWLATRFGYARGEWQYCVFKPRLFLEHFFSLAGDDPSEDYKFFCFNGKARLIQVHADRYTRHKCGQYDPSLNHVPVKFSTYEMAQFERPANLDAMIQAAETIATGLDFARIDLYSDRKSVIKFGEITFTPNNADERYADFQFDRWLGSWFAGGE
jgi:hypothetical protein